jgi:hypothetical protein
MSSSVPSRLSYSQALRVIGQFLEQVKPKELEIEFFNDEVVIRHRVVETIPSIRGKFGGLLGSASAKTQESTSERRYSVQEIVEADREGRTRRASPDTNADFYLLSQTLRTVGTYVEHRSLRLLGLSWDGSRLILRLEGADRQAKTEEHTVASFHDYFLRMYLKRKKQTTASFA